MLVETDPGVTEINYNGGCNQWVNMKPGTGVLLV